MSTKQIQNCSFLNSCKTSYSLWLGKYLYISGIEIKWGYFVVLWLCHFGNFSPLHTYSNSFWKCWFARADFISNSKVPPARQKLETLPLDRVHNWGKLFVMELHSSIQYTCRYCIFIRIDIWDHSFKTSANFWPLPPYHRHSSKILMTGIFDPYVLWPFEHRPMGTPLPPPKTCWRLKWMSLYVYLWITS